MCARVTKTILRKIFRDIRAGKDPHHAILDNIAIPDSWREDLLEEINEPWALDASAKD